MLVLRPVIICVLSCVIACNTNVNSYDLQKDKSITVVKQPDTGIKKSVRINKIDTFYERKQLMFKKWLIDTLKILDTAIVNFNNKSQGIKKGFSIASDSLGLSVKNIYDLPFYSNTFKKSDEVQKLLSVLKDYNENPQGQYILRFKVDYYFTPSPVPKLLYDMTLDMEDVQVSEQHGKKNTRYEIVRGRISEKHVSTLLKDGSQKEERINFLWKGSKLIKEPIN